MKQQKALYDDVVTGDELHAPLPEPPKPPQDNGVKKSMPSVEVPEKITGKDPEEAYVQGVKDAIKLKDNIGEKAVTSKEGAKEGIKEQAKEEAKDTELMKKKLNTLVKRNDVILFKAKSFFPLDFFPDEIIIDTTKISVVHKMFFATEQVTTINHKDITSVSVETSLLWGNVNILYLPKTDTASAIQPPEAKISLLWRRDAVRTHNIIRGITIANTEGVDLLKIPPDKLVKTIEEFGDSKAPI